MRNLSSMPMNDASARARLFDAVNTTALSKIWFVGDIHGITAHIERALVRAVEPPAWLVFAGDIDLPGTPFRTLIAQLRKAAPFVDVAFIHGNHDADSRVHWAMLHDAGDAVALHKKVHDLGGVRVAGLGGTFGRIWRPPGGPLFHSLQQALDSDPYRWPGQDAPHSDLNAAIYPDDLDELAGLSADVLVTHEAFSCHPKGYLVLDALGRSLGVARGFHGHQHDDLTATYAVQRDALGFDVQGLGLCGIKDGLGRVVSAHLEGW